MNSIPGSLSFAKLVMMSSAPAKSAGDATTDPKIHSSIRPVRSFYVERKDRIGGASGYVKDAN